MHPLPFNDAPPKSDLHPLLFNEWVHRKSTQGFKTLSAKWCICLFYCNLRSITKGHCNLILAFHRKEIY